MFHVAVYHLKYQQNDTNASQADDIYLLLISVSAVSLQEVERMPLWLIYIFFVLHKGEQFGSELKFKTKRKNIE